MPLFSNKFIPKKAPIRKSPVTEIGRDTDSLNDKELIQENGTVKLCLDEQETIFENGHWTQGSGTGDNSTKTNQKLRKQIQVLKEENNLLKLKFDLLLDMLTQATAENHLQQRELEKVKRTIK